MTTNVSSYADSRLRRARVYVEPAGSYGVDNTANLATSAYLDVEMTEGTPAPTPGTTSLNPNTLKQFKDQRDVQVHGVGTSALNFGATLASFGSVGGVAGLDGTTTAANIPVVSGTGIKWPQLQVIATLMGGNSAEAGGVGAQTKVQAGTTATVINVTSTHGARFVAGRCIGIAVNGRMEVRVVKSVSTDAVTVKVAFSGTPATNAVCYGSVTCYLKEDPNTTLQMVLEGMNAYDRYAYFGLQGTMGIDVKVGDMPKFTANLKGCGYAGTSSAAPGYSVLGGSDLAQSTLAQFSPVATRDAEFIVGTVGSTVRTTLNVPECTFTPAWDYVDVTSTATAAFNTILRKFRTRKDPVASGALTYYRDHAAFDFEAAFAADSVLALFYQIGSAAGSTILIEMPTVQFWQPTDKPVNNIAAQTCPWWARTDQELNDTTSELKNSAMRIHFL